MYENECVVKLPKIELDSVGNKMRESRFRWFGHIVQIFLSVHVRRCEIIYVRHKKKIKSKPLIM